MKPLVSIVIPIKNRTGFLERLFFSLQKQSLRPLEILLVDNDSTDTSYQKCLAFQKHSTDNFRIVLLSEKKAGASCCRNKGAMNASADFLYFFDSDDEISPTFLEEALAHITNYDMVCAPTSMFFKNGRQVVRYSERPTTIAGQLLTATLSTQTYVIRKDFFLRAGAWNESLTTWDDWELGVRLLLEEPRIFWLRKGFHKLYQHADSLTGNRFSLRFSALHKALQTVWQLLEINAGSAIITTASWNAFSAKCFLLSAELYRENERQQSECIKRMAYHPKASRLFLACSRLPYALGKRGVRGTWRLYAFLMRLFG